MGVVQASPTRNQARFLVACCNPDADSTVGYAMQSQTPAIPAPAPPPPPAPPIIVGPQGVTIGGVQPTIIEGLMPGDRLTDRQKEMIEERRSDMSDQITSASSRRDETAAQLRNATGADREGLEGRLRLLDERILQLEADLAYTGRLLYGEPGVAGTSAPPPNFPRNDGPNETAIGIVFTLFVLFPIALAFARLLWRRATGQAVARPSLESTQRLERVEQAVDSIAVEVERISEGQRFVTRILTEGSAQSVLNAGRAEQGAAQRREGVKVPRGES